MCYVLVGYVPVHFTPANTTPYGYIPTSLRPQKFHPRKSQGVQKPLSLIVTSPDVSSSWKKGCFQTFVACFFCKTQKTVMFFRYGLSYPTELQKPMV
jgi:hypothetical protein